MKILKSDNSYFIVQNHDHAYLILKVYRPDIDDYSKICVGEIMPTKYDTFEVKIVKRVKLINLEPQVVATTHSHDEAVDVLWEQRNLLHWGYYQ